MNNSDNELNEIYIENWDINYEKWDKTKFAESVGDYLAKHLPEYHEFDQHLIAILAIEMDTYVKCYLALQQEDLVIEDAKGNVIGQSPYVRIMLKQLANIRRLRKELKLQPKDRLLRK